MTIHILIDITYSCNRMMARVHFQPETIFYQMSSNTNYRNLNFHETTILQSMGLKLKMGGGGILREKFFLIVENIHVAQLIKERLLKCIV